MINRILVIIVLVLIPLAIKSYSSTELSVALLVDTLEVREYNLDAQEDIVVQVSSKVNSDEVENISLEEYVIGVVAGEMPASFDMEALKAQAVAARTYAVYKMTFLDGYVLSPTISDQVYLTAQEMQEKWGSDYEYYYEKIREAVTATEGEVITYDGDVIIAYYFAISNGYTDDSLSVFNQESDYLVSVESLWDKEYATYKSTRAIDKTTFCTKLGISCGDIIISNIIRSNNNYVRSVTINGLDFTGREVFNLLGLRSTDFTIEAGGDDVVITTYGFGHGVGMSQYGAQSMALLGYNYQDILTYYYQNTKIETL